MFTRLNLIILSDRKMCAVQSQAGTPPYGSPTVTPTEAAPDAMKQLLRFDWPTFVAALEGEGWDLGNIALGETQWRVAWKDQHLHAE